MKLAALLALALLAGCTTANVELQDGSHIQFTRFATDAAVKVDKDGLSYSSSPSAVVQQQTLDMLSQLLATAIKAGLVVAQPMPSATSRPSAFLARLQTPLHEGEI